MKILCHVCKASFEVSKENEKIVFEKGKEIVGPCGHKVAASLIAIADYKNNQSRYVIWLTPELRRQIGIAAATEGSKLSDWVRDAMLDALARFDRKQVKEQAKGDRQDG